MARHVHIHFTPRKTRDQAPGSVPAGKPASPYTAIVDALMQAIADRQRTQDGDQARAPNGEFAPSGGGGGGHASGSYNAGLEEVAKREKAAKEKAAHRPAPAAGSYNAALKKVAEKEAAAKEKLKPKHPPGSYLALMQAEADKEARNKAKLPAKRTKDGGEWDENSHPRSNGGQFTAGMHTAAAANHEKAEANHKASAASAPQGSQPAMEHTGAALRHAAAAQAHHAAAKHLAAGTGLGGMHASQAHQATYNAASSSGKIQSTGASDVHGQLKAIASDPSAPLAKRAEAVKQLGEIEKMADAVAESPHAAKPAHGPVTTAALAGGADVGVNEAAARAQFKAAGSPGMSSAENAAKNEMTTNAGEKMVWAGNKWVKSKPGPDGKPMGTHPALAAANKEILKNPSTTPPDVLAEAKAKSGVYTLPGQTPGPSPLGTKEDFKAQMKAGFAAEAAKSSSTPPAPTGKPTASTAKGKAGVHELLSSGHPFSVDELMKATGVTNKSTLMTALSDLKSPKYAGKLGALEIVKRPDGQYHVAKKDGGAAPSMVLDPKSSTMVPKVDLSSLQAKSDAHSSEALKTLLASKTSKTWPDGTPNDNYEAQKEAYYQAKPAAPEPKPASDPQHTISDSGRSPAMKHHGDMEGNHKMAAEKEFAQNGNTGKYRDHTRAAQLHANALSEAKNKATGYGGTGYDDAAKNANGLSKNMGLDPLNTNSKPGAGTPAPSGKRELSTGHTAHTTRLESGHTRHTVSGAGLTAKHYINHDPDGKVTSHMIETPTKVQSVKGPTDGSNKQTLTPAESEAKYPKLHAALRGDAPSTSSAKLAPGVGPVSQKTSVGGMSSQAGLALAAEMAAAGKDLVSKGFAHHPAGSYGSLSEAVHAYKHTGTGEVVHVAKNHESGAVEIRKPPAAAPAKANVAADPYMHQALKDAASKWGGSTPISDDKVKAFVDHVGAKRGVDVLKASDATGLSVGAVMHLNKARLEYHKANGPSKPLNKAQQIDNYLKQKWIKK